MGLISKKRLGHPSKVSDEELLHIIGEFKKISQPDLQKATGIKQNTLSLQIKKLKDSEKITTHKIRRGWINISTVSLNPLENQKFEVENQKARF